MYKLLALIAFFACSCVTTQGGRSGLDLESIAKEARNVQADLSDLRSALAEEDPELADTLEKITSAFDLVATSLEGEGTPADLMQVIEVALDMTEPLIAYSGVDAETASRVRVAVVVARAVLRRIEAYAVDPPSPSGETVDDSNGVSWTIREGRQGRGPLAPSPALA